MKATIHECGNGFPTVGDRIYEPHTDSILVITWMGPIQTRQYQANYVHAEVESTGCSAGDVSEEAWLNLSDCQLSLEDAP